jgi:hypothetical protein
MCIICDGASPDEAMFDLEYRITRFGWAVQWIEAGEGRPGWAYTIGLAARFLHRELVVVSCDPRHAHGLLTELVERIETGEHFLPDTRVTTVVDTYDLVDVHPRQIDEGLIGTWHDYYRAIGDPGIGPRPLQVIVPELVCRTHRAYLALDQPEPTLSGHAFAPPRPRPRRRRSR